MNVGGGTGFDSGVSKQREVDTSEQDMFPILFFTPIRKL